jgi:hypothetical protein
VDSLQLEILAFLTACGAVITKLMVRRNVARENARSGCIACESPAIRVEGDTVVCERCGYTGKADRGGKLSEKEVREFFTPER